jgi:hypothetical protein
MEADCWDAANVWFGKTEDNWSKMINFDCRSNCYFLCILFSDPMRWCSG